MTTLDFVQRRGTTTTASSREHGADAARRRLELRGIAGAALPRARAARAGRSERRVLDYGCGYGALAEYLTRASAHRGALCGLRRQPTE